MEPIQLQKQSQMLTVYTICLAMLSEHCNDYWSSGYSFGAVTDPMGPATGDYTSVHGGNWGNSELYIRASNRAFDAPDYPYFFIGFRLMRPDRI